MGAYAEITRINAHVPKKLDKTEEEMRDFLFENPIDYKMGRGRLSMLRVHTTVGRAQASNSRERYTV